MKLGKKIRPNDILDLFENGSDWLKNMAARERGIFPYMAVVKKNNTLKLTFIVQSCIHLVRTVAFNEILNHFESNWL